MKYIEHVGKIYDVLYYGMIYFNKPAVIKKFTECNHNLDGAFSFFEEVKNSCKSLPQCLYPFFYYDSVTPSVLSEYMRLHINFHVHKFVDYLDLIQIRDHFKKFVFDHLFFALSDDDKDKLLKKDSSLIYKVIENSTWPSAMTEQIIMLVHHFTYAADKLYDYLKEIYKHIDKLHKKYNNIIQKRIEETTEKDMLQMLDKIYSLSEKKAEKQLFSLCFMNQFVRISKKDDQEESVFLFGNRFKEALVTACNDQPVTIDTLLITLGNETRLNVIRLFQKYGKLTLSDISRFANVSTSTAFNIINILLEGTIVHESHKDGQKIYLSLNINMLTISKDIYTDFIDDILLTNLLREGNDCEVIKRIRNEKN